MADVIVRYGGKEGKPYRLSESAQFLVVRTRSRMSIAESCLGARSRKAMEGWQTHARFVEHGVEILRLPHGDTGARDAARVALKQDGQIEFAGRVLVPADDHTDHVDGGDVRARGFDSAPERSAAPVPAPVVFTENLFVKFADRVKATTAKQILARHKLVVKRRTPFAANGYFIGAPDGIGQSVFEVADSLLAEEAVDYCHPELAQPRNQRKAFPQQWHLKATRVGGRTIDAHASITKAWRLSEGKGSTIAIIDDGVDIDHVEFSQRGSVVAPRDVTQDGDDPRPGRGDNHGTACAGVACADGRRGASGVAPASKLMPIRLASALGSMDEAEAFAWAADHGADVISCSWGPTDGAWWNPNDPQHRLFVPLPDSTRLAMDYAATHGRGGKGCVICFAAGNGNESVDLDGYASYKNVIAVAACNDTSTRSVYSDFGKAVFCAFPSSDFADEETGHPAPLTPGIWTTDRSGNAGYNPGGDQKRGDDAGDFTAGFGGTSSAAPGVAGVAALILGKKRTLRAADVRDVIRQSCDRIDEAGGRYDATGRSPYYGYGRVNAYRAVQLAAKTG